MPAFKLYYFPLKGRAELARILFAYAGVEYEDLRIQFTDWPALKEEMPYKQLPVLEVDGKRFSQSDAIVRYLAREFGLIGKSSADFAKADELAEAIRDIQTLLPLTEPNEEKRKEKLHSALNQTIPAQLAIIEANLTGDFYAGDLSYGDIAFGNAADILLYLKPDILDQTPKLKALYQRVFAIAGIANYIKRRPKAHISYYLH